MLTNTTNRGDSAVSEHTSPESPVILQMVGIDKRFQGVHALKQCHLELRRGEIHALVGENGAGKSTLMKVLTGIYKADEGKIIYNGKEVQFKNPKEAQEAGISIVHQELNLMNHLTAAQNIFIGRECKGFFLHDDQINAATQKLFDHLKLTIRPTDKVGSLTVGKQQMVEITKAISFDSSVLILDEPSAALTEAEITELFKTMNDLRNRGVTMVYISHRMDEIMEITDRITVMRDGEYITTLNTKDTNLDEIINAMVGRTIYEEPKTVSNVPPDAPVVLEVENLVSKDVKGVSFQLHKGEILGFAGLMGAGRTETARLIFGADPRDGGVIRKNGTELHIKTPEDAVKAGIGYLSEDRKRVRGSRWGCPSRTTPCSRTSRNSPAPASSTTARSARPRRSTSAGLTSRRRLFPSSSATSRAGTSRRSSSPSGWSKTATS